MVSIARYRLAWWLGAIVALTLTGCDMLGIESTEQTNAKKEADGKAIGSACRHAMRAIEDCYVLNPKASRSAIFNGWREMDEYMRENQIQGVAPTIPRKGEVKKTSEADAETTDATDAGAASNESKASSATATEGEKKQDKSAEH